jgi:hypothetical protein
MSVGSYLIEIELPRRIQVFSFAALSFAARVVIFEEGIGVFFAFQMRRSDVCQSESMCWTNQRGGGEEVCRRRENIILEARVWVLLELYK